MIGGHNLIRFVSWTIVHVFRKFEEAKPDHPEAEKALAWIGVLYAVDERAGDDLERRAELRRTESVGARLAWWWFPTEAPTVVPSLASARVASSKRAAG